MALNNKLFQENGPPQFRPPKLLLPSEPSPPPPPPPPRHHYHRAHLCISLTIHPLVPATPHRFSGVPFSWEHSPGIPKNQSYKKKDCSSKDLPLPPPAASTSISKRFNSEEIGARKKNNNDSFRRDPFFAAFVECSKDEDDRDSSNNSFWAGPKVSRSISDRFGFINLYSSCKKSSAVSESIVYLPRSSRTSYDIISRRSR
ncbi:hypothetical protein OIU78_022945 [Salix suchowensis]|nr:hypothetical protein OIU78_022945 [Salix suchowensis]